MPIVIPPVGTDLLESFILDGLELNDNITFRVEAATHVPAPKRPEWVSGADSDGAILGRDPLHDNCTWDLRLRVVQQASMDTALAQIAVVLDKLQECSRNANGLALVWTPRNSTLDPITWRCLLGEVTERPIDNGESGWFQHSPVLGLRLTCSPAGLGTETLLGTVTSSDPLVSLILTDLPGDLDLLGRVVVTDAASQSRRWVAWGMESRWLPTTSPPSLLIDSTSLVTTGYAGVTATRSGAYSGATNNVISATLRTQVQAICGLGNLSHVGVFRPQLRFYASATTMAVRLTYQTLDGPFRSLSYKVPVVAGWNHVDLGLVTIPQTALGTQRWTGRIEAYSTATGGETFEVDYTGMMPADPRFGRGRAVVTWQAGLIAAYDSFTGSTAAAVLHTATSGRAAPLGGNWVTSGAATDFTYADDAPTTGDETVVRAVSGAGPRYAVLGATAYTNIEVGVRVQRSDYSAGSATRQKLRARWVDSGNNVAAYIGTGADGDYLIVDVTVASTPTAYVGGKVPTRDGEWYALSLVVYSSGALAARCVGPGGAVLATVFLRNAALATGGALDDGAIGFSDESGGTTSRYYDDFYAATPAAEPIVIHSGQSIEFRHDTVLREDSTGVYAGPPPEYVGSRCLIPNAGGPGREARIAVMAKRNDVETTADDNIADSTTVQVWGQPRYLVVPR
jgi:hypothetical protein